MTQIIPTGNQLLVKPVEETEAPGELRIIVPDLAKKDKHTGRVIAVGPSASIISQDPSGAGGSVVVDDVIIYRTHSTTEIEVDGEKYLVMPIEGVLVILR